MSTRLSGWWRLWIVGVVFYGLLVTLVMRDLLFVKPEDIRYADEHIRHLSTRSLEILSGNVFDQFDSDLKRPKDPQGDQKSALGNVVEMPNGAKLTFLKKATTEQQSEVAIDYMNVLEIFARNQRLDAAKEAALLWLIPSLFSLVAGWAIGWIYRGFKRP